MNQRFEQFRRWVSERVSSRAVALVLMLVLASFSAGLYVEGNVPHGSGGGVGTGPIVPSTIVLNHRAQVSCTSATMCTTSAITPSLYDSIEVVVSALSVTAPSQITSSPSYTWTAGVSVSSSTTHNRETVVYYTDNVSASSTTVTVKFASNTNYGFEVLDYDHAATSPYVAGPTSTGSVTEPASGTNEQPVSLSKTLLGGSPASVMLMACTINDTSSVTTIASDGVSVQQDVIGGSGAVAGGTYSIVATYLPAPGQVNTETVEIQGHFSATYYYACVSWILVAAVPGTVVTVALGAVGTTTVALSWTDGVGPYTNEKIFQAPYTTSCGSYSTTYTTGGKLDGYTVTGLTSGNAYCFYVEVSNTTGYGAASNILSDVVTAHVPAAPTGLTATPVYGSTTQIALYFVQPTGGSAYVTDSTLYRYAGGSCGGSATTTDMGTDSGLDFNFTLGGLTTNTLYSFKVTGTNATGESAKSSCVSATTNVLPGAASGLGASTITQTSFVGSWTNPAGTLANDTFLWGTTCGTWTYVSLGIVTTYTLTSLNPATTYCWTVEPWSPGGAGPLTHPYLNVTTSGGPPTAPTYLNGTPGVTTMGLQWHQGNGGSLAITNDTTYAGTSCGTSAASSWSIGAFSTGTPATTYSFGSLAASTTYCFAVAAWTVGGESALTYGNFTTLNAGPGAPTGLHEIGASRHNWTVGWVQPAGLILNDTLGWGTTSGCGGTQTYNSTGISTSFTVGGLVPFTAYYVRVSAWTSGGQGPWSSCLTVVTQNSTPPAPIINITLTTVGATYVVLVWNEPNPLYILFNNTVYWDMMCHVGTTGWAHVVSTNGVTSFYNVTGLAPTTSYCFAVTAWDGQSNLSAPYIAITFTGSGGTGTFGIFANTEGWLLLGTGASVILALAGVLIYLLDRRRGGGGTGEGPKSITVRWD